MVVTVLWPRIQHERSRYRLGARNQHVLFQTCLAGLSQD